MVLLFYIEGKLRNQICGKQYMLITVYHGIFSILRSKMSFLNKVLIVLLGESFEIIFMAIIIKLDFQKGLGQVSHGHLYHVFLRSLFDYKGELLTLRLNTP